MDIFYYSNYCPHSQRILQFLVKGNLTEKISFICIDNRFYDKKTNQTRISLENGTQVILPPNVHSVPALLLTNKNYQLILGDEIIKYYEPAVKKQIAESNFGNGEPQAFSLNMGENNVGTNIISEKFTSYNMSVKELGAKGYGKNREMYNYVSAEQNNAFIQTPPDNYKPDKISTNVNMDDIEKKRNAEIQTSSLFIPSM